MSYEFEPPFFHTTDDKITDDSYKGILQFMNANSFRYYFGVRIINDLISMGKRYKVPLE